MKTPRQVSGAVCAESAAQISGSWNQHMERIVKSLLTGNFEMPMSDCALRQCGLDYPIVYEGPGLLTQEQDKSILLRVFVAPVDHSEAFNRHFNGDLTPGELVPDSQYYDFEGRDPYGTVWRANRISIETDFGSGTYVRARPRTLEKTEERSKPVERPVVVAFLPRKIELPWHAVTEKGERGWSVDRFERNTGRLEWRIAKTDDGAWLTFKCEDSPVEPRLEAFLRGLSILMGRWLKPICLSIFEGERQTTRMLNRLHEPDAEKLLAPIRTQRDLAEDAHLFLERFMEKAADENEGGERACDLVHRYWHRILRSRENDIENSSLVLSVALEGLVKKTLLSKKDVDPEFVKQAEEAKPILKKAGLGPRALACVLSSLGNAKHPRVQDALRRLATEGVASEAHIEAWKGLRNAAAHGSVLEEDDRALQEHLDRFHVCLDLYYRLVFLLIGYDGRHTDYGTRGWPTRAFRLGGELTASAAAEPVSPPECALGCLNGGHLTA